MKIEKIRIRNFRCFGPEETEIELENCVTAFVGGNGCGKTAVFLALSRLFGVTRAQRSIQRRDFHIPANREALQPDTILSIDVTFSFPELKEAGDDGDTHAVPEFFRQMTAAAPGDPLKTRMRLQAKWVEDGTTEGAVEEEFRWVTGLDNDFKWDQCTKVQPGERGHIQFIYIPSTRDASEQAAALLKGRLWQAATWSDQFEECSRTNTLEIQEQFNKEKPVETVVGNLSHHWKQLHHENIHSVLNLQLVEGRFGELVRKAEFTLSPAEDGRTCDLSELSDGQRSLFHIALTAAALTTENEAFARSEAAGFNPEKLKQTSLTFLAIEEPENCLSPFFLSRIVGQAREIGALPSAQVALSSHSPAILGRIDPEEVRHFRLDHDLRSALVRRITLPTDDEEAKRYVRLAVRAYPELYFARFVILGEGESERIIIPWVAESMGVRLDPSFVPIVPLGGRYAGYFWRLLNDLEIPHATLLDLDLGRTHGGVGILNNVNEWLKNADRDLGKIETDDTHLLTEGKNNDVLKRFEEEGIFFSFPLDIDFSMIRAFPDAYKVPVPGGRGPNSDASGNKKTATLKEDGDPSLYNDSYDDVFKWYPYLFLNRGKPGTHIAALARISDNGNPKEKAPPELKALINHVKKSIGLRGDGE